LRSRAAQAYDTPGPRQTPGTGEQPLRHIVYFHGFASSPRGRKIALLRERLEPEGFRLFAPDLNVPSFEKLDFKTMARLAVWEARKRLPAVLVGSSLGALVALEVARRAPAAPLVLIAPALGFGARWIDRLPAGDSIPVFHFGEERQIPIHRRFFEQMARAETDGRPPAVPVISIMGSRDESVPVDQVREVWRRWESSGELAAGSRWIEIAGGDHGLVAHIDRIAAEIREAADLTARPVSRSPC
jgi:pimeloyl-ACP methyl ester carboxylesterase